MKSSESRSQEGHENKYLCRFFSWVSWYFRAFVVQRFADSGEVCEGVQAGEEGITKNLLET